MSFEPPATKPEPVPEPTDDTARRAAVSVRKRRARGGRARTILEGQSPESIRQQNAPQPARLNPIGAKAIRRQLLS